MPRIAAVLAAGILIASCSSPTPSPTGTSTAVGPTPAASPEASVGPSPSPSGPGLPASFPLAVVTGMENLKPATTLADLKTLASTGKLIVPCGIQVTAPAIAPTAQCLPADQIAAWLQAHPTVVALLPAGLVEPATKTLPIGGDGPFGLGGADLFGDPAARALPYPVTGRADGTATIDPAWVAYDASTVWTLASSGDDCSDAAVAWQALAQHKGWPWIFGGGTARYAQGPHPNPNPPPGISVFPVVTPVETGHAGAVARLLSSADLTIADVECPIVTNFVPNYGGVVHVFSISSAVMPIWRDQLGRDVVYLAANHDTDYGVPGVKSTLSLLAKYGIKGVGLGLNLDQAMTPAIVQRAGVSIAFVAWNDIPGSTRATSTVAGVPWLTQANVIDSVKRARAAGAQVVICDPQWWGGAEYHSDLAPGQLTQLAWFDQAGCDEVVGAGTHLAGPLLLRQMNGHVGMVLASEGNFTFGQDWWQDTQEGVILSAAFRGSQLVNVHLWPYVLVANARVALTDPPVDGRYVLGRVFQNGNVDYLPTPAP